MSVTSNANAAPSPWHARQAAMLYEYSSLGYLKKLHQVVAQLIDGVVDPLLTGAMSQGRDSLLINAQWGTRNTAKNWSNNAWPFLRDLEISLAKDIAMRAFDKYKAAKLLSLPFCPREVEGLLPTREENGTSDSQ